MPGAPGLSPAVVLQVRSLANSISGDLPVLAEKGLQVVAVLVVAIIANRLARALSQRIIRAVDDGDPTTLTAAEQRGHTIAQLLNSVGRVAIVVTAGLMILSVFVPIAPLLASVGVAGLAISFGAQSLVKDVISGFFILMENQFAVGDVIEIEGVSGTVERMTLRVVMIRDADGVLHIIPNGSIPRVSNKTRGFAKSVIDVPVSYKQDVDQVMKVLRQVAADLWKDGRWKLDLVDEPTVLGVEALRDNSVVLRVVATTRPGRQWDMAREFRRRIKNRFDQEGIVIAQPQRPLQLSDAQVEILAARSQPKPAAGL